jgi:hypothetical protein
MIHNKPPFYIITIFSTHRKIIITFAADKEVYDKFFTQAYLAFYCVVVIPIAPFWAKSGKYLGEQR